jgi:hypothetical protein
MTRYQDEVWGKGRGSIPSLGALLSRSSAIQKLSSMCSAIQKLSEPCPLGFLWRLQGTILIANGPVREATCASILLASLCSLPPSWVWGRTPLE